MSGSRWVALWVNKGFLYSSSVYSYHLFLTLSASFRSIPFMSFIVLIIAWNVSFISLIFLKRSLVFPILLPLFLCTIHLRRPSYLSLLFFGTLHSDCFSPFLLCLLLLFFSHLFVRPPQTTILPFCISFLLGMVSIIISCTMLQTSMHSSSGTLITFNPLNLFVTSTVES